MSGTSYPKQEKGKQVLKRKREDNIDDDQVKKWEQQDRVTVPYHLKGSMQAMLKAEYPEIPVHFINDTLAKEKHLYQAFIALAKAKDGNDGGTHSYGKGRASRRFVADASTIATNCGWPELLDEMNAARVRVQANRAERAAEEARKQAEKDNLQRAIEAGETTECSACYDDLPMNRQVHCNGSVAHFTCFECAENYIKSEVGESRCRVLCTAGCGSGFASHQLNFLSNKQLLEKLSQLEQEKAIRDAELDDLEDCPFCDFKAILPPIEEDFEFRCANPTCEKVSCRRCKSISHIPISCEQHAKDNKVNSRHKIEEAMTAAMIRSCNKCKKQFIKDYGCNKMSCASCGNLQCYVCSATLKDYNHFDQQPQRTGGGGSNSKLCPLYDNVEERHEREVKEAEATARAQVAEENPELTAEDLEIKVSDAVKKQTADRVRQAGGPAGGMHMAHLNMQPAPHQGFFGNLFGLGGIDDEEADRMDGLLDGDDMLGEVMRRGQGERRHVHRGRVHHDPRLDPLQEARDRLDRARNNHAAGQRLGNAGPAPPPQAPANRYGLGGHLQGWLPVFGFGAQPAVPGAQAPNNHGVPQPPPSPDPRNRYLQYQRRHPDPYGGYNFGADGAADGRHPPAPAPHIGRPRYNHNYENINPNPAAERLRQIPHIPGGFPQEGGALGYRNDPHLEDQHEARQNYRRLELLRQQHDQRMQQRQNERLQHTQDLERELQGLGQLRRGARDADMR